VRLVTILLTLAMAVLVAGAGPAVAGKGKKKDPKYTASMSATGQMSADVDCEAWTSHWTYGGEYYPTTLESAASLDARSRTGGGTIDWSEYVGCPPITPTYGSCPIVVESPEPGVHAGDEDAFLQKATGGLRVRVEFVQFMTPVGTAETCRGAVYSGGGPEGFIPSAKIGRKVITVPIAGSFSLVDGSEHSEGQIDGTLTLTRKGKRKG
jgi:hypothetical protein